MRNTIPCRHCGTPVEFGEEDRGFTEYCGSCGRAVEIPAAANVEEPWVERADSGDASTRDEMTTEHSATESPSSEPTLPVESTPPDEPPATSSGPASVFSISGRAVIGRRVVAEEECLCGRKVPVRVEDYGATVYCPSCGTEIRVGKSLEGGKFPIAKQVDEEDAVASASATVHEPRGRLIGSLLRLAIGSIAVLLLVAIEGWLAGRFWGNVVRPVGDRTIVAAGSIIEETSPGDQGNRDAPISSDSEGPKVVSRITQTMIEQLRTIADPAAALVQAQVWQETLRDQETPQEDPRQVLLGEVIEELTERLSPTPKGPSAPVVEFRKCMRQFAESLAAGDLDAARLVRDEMARLLQDHPDELAGYSQSLSSVGKHLEREESLAAAVERIRREIRRAEEVLGAGHLSEALKAEARAQFLKQTTPVTDAEEAELRRQYRDLSRRTRLARGERAVRDAERCDEAGDVQARNQEVRRALALLPGLPERQVRPWLERLDKWLDKSGNLPPSPDEEGPSPTSSIAREIRFRDQYESTLDHYARGNYDELLAAVLETERMLVPIEPQSVAIHVQLGDLLFDVVGQEVDSWAESNDSEPNDEALVQSAKGLRTFLDQLGPWKTDPRWKSLDESIRSMAGENE